MVNPASLIRWTLGTLIDGASLKATTDTGMDAETVLVVEVDGRERSISVIVTISFVGWKSLKWGLGVYSSSWRRAFRVETVASTVLVAGVLVMEVWEGVWESE